MHLAVKDLEALLSSAPTPSLQHLLTCARCRRNLTSVLFDLDVPGEELVTADLGEASIGEARRGDFADPSFRETVLQRALALGESEGQRPPVTPEARLSSRDLLNGPPDLRLEVIATEARFRDLGVAEVLLSEARTVSTDDPLQSRHLAGLAAAILEGLAPSSRGDRLQAEAAGILGDAERRGGRLDLADDFFKQAAWAMRDQPLILSARAILCRLSAALRQEQGRVDEALGLLEHASTLAEELGDFKELAFSRLAYGWLLLDEFDTERAILPLREALSLFSTRSTIPIPSSQLSTRSPWPMPRSGITTSWTVRYRCSTSSCQAFPIHSTGYGSGGSGRGRHGGFSSSIRPSRSSKESSTSSPRRDRARKPRSPAWSSPAWSLNATRTHRPLPDPAPGLRPA